VSGTIFLPSDLTSTVRSFSAGRKWCQEPFYSRGGGRGSGTLFFRSGGRRAGGKGIGARISHSILPGERVLP